MIYRNLWSQCRGLCAFQATTSSWNYQLGVGARRPGPTAQILPQPRQLAPLAVYGVGANGNIAYPALSEEAP